MKKIIFIIIGLILIGGGVVLLFKSKLFTKGGEGMLKIDSEPIAAVFIDDKEMGNTPYENKITSGDHLIKIVPTDSNIISWEQKVTVNSNLLTYVKRYLGESELTSGGQILTMEKNSAKEPEISVITIPDGAVVQIDNEEKGKAPLIISDKSVGNYDVGVSIDGYKPDSVRIKTIKGYKLNIVFQLVSLNNQLASPVPEPTATPEATPKVSPKTSLKATPKATASVSASLKPKASPPEKPYVEILTTPTGYLNVRKEPSTTASILTKVYPGEYYFFVEEKNDWFKIKYKDEETGWISSQYADKFE